MPRSEYKLIADELAADIEAGRLQPGERLLPQREFAFQRGIAPATASRVYLTLIRKGLITGEVGRGTFVRSSAPPRANIALVDPVTGPVDLEMNFPILESQVYDLGRALEQTLLPKNLADALRPIGAKAASHIRETVAGFLRRGGWQPLPDQILVTGNGRQAIAASLNALLPAGSRIGVEALTYPVVLGIAERLKLEVVPIEIDNEGIVPSKLAAIHRATPLKAVYLQTYLHNPLGVGMGLERRNKIASFLREHDLPAIEDAIYSFLVDDPPLAALAPDQVILVDSLSKRIAPGLTLGMIVAAPRYQEKIEAALRSGAWTAGGFALSAALQLMSDGSAQRLQSKKRDDAAARQKLARTTLAGLEIVGDPRAYHLVLTLPDIWRADEYVAAAFKRGVSTVGVRAFAVGAGHAPNAVRLALASPSIRELSRALAVLRELALFKPDRQDVG